MGKFTRFLLLAVGAFLVLIVIAALAIPAFLNADSFRARVEADLSKSLGRPVTMSKLNLSILSGGLIADNIAIADDPRFSTAPFIQAQSVKISVALFPLIFHKDVQIKGFTLQDPRVNLFSGIAAGKPIWNYSSLGATSSTPQAKSAGNSGTLNNLTAGNIEIANGSITVGKRPLSPASPDHTYNGVNLTVKNFGSAAAFPFTLSANLPGEGTVSAKGTAGPIDQRDAADTPFSINLQVKHLDPLAAGFLDASSGISGLIDTFNLDAAYTGRQMHISQLTLGSPHLTIAQSSAPKPKQPAEPNQPSLLQNLSIDTASISNGSVTLTTPGKPGQPVVYQNIDAKLTNLTPTSQSPFQLTAQLPGSGSVSANGKAGPYNDKDAAATPLTAQVTLKGIQLGEAGLLPADAAIGGTLSMNTQLQSNGQTLAANGQGQVVNLKLARDATPSPKPLDVQFAVTKDLTANSGQIQRAVVSVGGVALNIAGTFRSAGPSTDLNFKVNGSDMPIDAIEAFLPALGIHLPQGSQLRGGTLTTALAVTGSSAAPAVSGPVDVKSTQLAGFDLGAKLGQLSQLTGGKLGAATGSGTNIRSLTMNVTEQNNNIRTDNVNLDVAGVGTATGAGTVAASGALNYAVLLKLTGLTAGSAAPAQSAAAPAQGGGGLAGLAGNLLGGSGGKSGLPGVGSIKGLGATSGLTSGLLARGIPVEITGTTSHPTFAPNLRGLTTGIGAAAAQQYLGGKTGTPAPAQAPQKPADQVKKALGGFLGH